MSKILKLLLTATLATALAGCGSGVKLDEDPKAATIETRDAAAAAAAAAAAREAAARDAAAAAARAPTVSVDPRTVTPVTVDPKDPLTDPASPLAKRSVYFEYDSFVLQSEYLPLMEAHARYLNADRKRRVIIEGNSDERGPREYNLALGQRRAEAVRRGLTTLGVADNQTEAVSFGEERLRAAGADEASHAENRRADIVYK